MEDAYLEAKHAPARTAHLGKRQGLRCSIVLPASTTPEGIREFVGRLNSRCLSAAYEVVIDVHAARGKFLLLMRQVVPFDVHVLEESIRELERSGNQLSVSDTGNFTLVERSFYLASRELERSGAIATNSHELARTDGGDVVHRVRNLNGDPVEIRTGADTFIDPETIVDSPQSVRIGAHCTIRKGVVLRPEGGEIVMGDNCTIDPYCVLDGGGGIHLGDWTVIAPHCSLHAHHHEATRFDIPLVRQVGGGHGIFLMGDDWVGHGTVIEDDVTIGKGTIIWPNSTVTESLPMACLARGAPAQITGRRHCGDWDTRKEERAVAEGMPEKVYRHVMKRAALIEQWIGPKDRVLDVGCGEGLVTALLARRAAAIVGIDYSKEAVLDARRRYPAIEFICGNSTHLPFPNESFTKVTMSDVAEHLMPAQFVRSLREIHRVLRADGVLVLATPLTARGTHGANYAHIYEYGDVEMTRILGGLLSDIRLIDKEFGLFVACKKSASPQKSTACSQKGASVPHGGKSTS